MRKGESRRLKSTTEMVMRSSTWPPRPSSARKVAGCAPIAVGIGDRERDVEAAETGGLVADGDEHRWAVGGRDDFADAIG